LCRCPWHKQMKRCREGAGSREQAVPGVSSRAHALDVGLVDASVGPVDADEFTNPARGAGHRPDAEVAESAFDALRQDIFANVRATCLITLPCVPHCRHLSTPILCFFFALNAEPSMAVH
jgi:hypothetical protein